MEQTFDLVVIGAGPGGYVAAIRAAQLGMQVAVVEMQEVGGTCLNRGCIPTKTLLHSADLYREISQMNHRGIHVDGLRYDLEQIYARKDAVVTQLRGGIETLLAQNHVERVVGHACLTAHDTVRIGDTLLKARNILIATGSKPFLPPIDGIEHALTSDGILHVPPQMRRLTIIGGGVIGVEFASVFSALGVEVSVIEAMDRILPPFDREISQNLTMILKKRGVKLYTSARVEQITGAGPFTCRFRVKDTTETCTSDIVLCAVGRMPQTEGLFGEDFTVDMERGRIVVDADFRTNVKQVYAIGDVSSRIQLAHVASAQGIAAVETMCGADRSQNLNVIPSCVYTSPEIACVGMTAAEAKEREIAVITGKFLLTASGKALIESSERSFMKLVLEADSGVIIGAQLMCPRATDLIGEVTNAIAHRMTKEQFASVVRPHPTFCEAFSETIESIDGHAIHVAPRISSRK